MNLLSRMALLNSEKWAVTTAPSALEARLLEEELNNLGCQMTKWISWRMKARNIMILLRSRTRKRWSNVMRTSAMVNMTAFTVKGHSWEQEQIKTPTSTTQYRSSKRRREKFMTYSETETRLQYTKATKPMTENPRCNSLPSTGQ